MDKIRVLLVEDMATLRYSLAECLATEPDLEVVGQAGDGRRALELARELRPEVVLTDIQMPRMDGIELTRRLREELPETRVVILTVYDDDDNLFSALKAGALGYILKDASVADVAEALRAAHRGEGVLHPPLVARVMQEFARLSTTLQKHREVFAELSRREVEILELIGAGARNKEIADKLFISERTVKNHVSAVLSKLQVNSRTEAALLASQYGLTQRDRRP